MFSNKELFEMLQEEGASHLTHVPSTKIKDPVAAVMIEDLRDNIQQLESYLENHEEQDSSEEEDSDDE
jgi:hypothetical protein